MPRPRIDSRRGLLRAALVLAAAAGAIGFGMFSALSSDGASTTAAAIREAVGRYVRAPAVVYPVCVSRTNPAYAKAGVYQVPVNYTDPFQVVLHRSGPSWRVVAWRNYDPLGWIANRDNDRYPKAVVRERWCRSVPHTPIAIRAALAKKLAAVSTFGRTLPYVPTLGWPEYKPGGLGYSVDGGRIYHIEKWLSYGERSAKARATWDYNACKPSCVNDKRTRVTFVITLTDPKPCRDVMAYTTLTVSRSSNTKLLPNGPWNLKRFCS